jgi:hypothetical protein
MTDIADILVRSAPGADTYMTTVDEANKAAEEDKAATAGDYRRQHPGSPPLDEVDYGAMHYDGYTLTQDPATGEYQVPKMYQLPPPVDPQKIIEREQIRAKTTLLDLPPAHDVDGWDYTTNMLGAVGQGVRNAAQEYVDVSNSLGVGLAKMVVGEPEMNPAEMALWYKAHPLKGAPILPNAEWYTPGQSAVADLVMPLAQFATGYAVGPARLLKGATLLPKLGEDFLRSGVATALSFDPDQGNVGTLLRNSESVGSLLGKIGITDEDMALLDSTEGRSEFEKRLKLFVEDGLIGGIGTAAVKGVKLAAGTKLAGQIASGIMDAIGTIEGSGDAKAIGNLRQIGAIGEREKKKIAEGSPAGYVPQPAQTVGTRVIKTITDKQRAAGKAERAGVDDRSLRTGRESMAQTPASFKKNMATFDNAVTSFKPLRKTATAEAKFDHVVRGMADNLIWLYNRFPKEYAETAKLWYTGGNKLTRELADKHGLAHGQTIAAMATQSPQKDWFQNVGLAQRITDGLAEGRKRSFQATDEMREWAQQYADDAHKVRLNDAAKDLAKGSVDQSGYDKMVKYSQEKLRFDRESFEVLKEGRNEPLTDPEAQARWIRAWDETENSRSYNTLHPDGSIVGPALKKNGDPRSIAWGDFNTIAKGAAVLDPALKNDPEKMMKVISEALGDEHKVRSFYNNNAHPLEGTSVTSDTHNVAAALFKPLSGKSMEVKHNFGGGVGASASIESGASGTYGVYHEAVNLAAKEAGIIPAQMQSITWEAIRSLFKPEQKNAKLTKFVNDTWKKVQKGKMTREEGFEAIFTEAGGFSKPAWAP